jgi:hypothetical protein
MFTRSFVNIDGEFANLCKPEKKGELIETLQGASELFEKFQNELKVIIIECSVANSSQLYMNIVKIAGSIISEDEKDILSKISDIIWDYICVEDKVVLKSLRESFGKDENIFFETIGKTLNLIISNEKITKLQTSLV